MNIKEKYQCRHCEETHSGKYGAENCCPPREVLVCGACGKVYDEYDRAEAEQCCASEASKAVVRDAFCHFCNEGPLAFEDVRDSKILGSLPRCRTHILAVAPELLTADAITLGRTA
jgi:hypothetical protein